MEDLLPVLPRKRVARSHVADDAKTEQTCRYGRSVRYVFVSFLQEVWYRKNDAGDVVV